MHHPSGLVHWWVLVHSGWVQGRPVQEGLPLYWAASLIMPDKWYGSRALHPWPQGPPIFKGCNALLPGLSLTTHRNLWIKFHKMTNYFMLYFILFYFMLYFIFTPGGLSSKSWHVMFWVRTSQYGMQFNTKFSIEEKTDLKSLPEQSEVWILSRTIAAYKESIGERV